MSFFVLKWLADSVARRAIEYREQRRRYDRTKYQRHGVAQRARQKENRQKNPEIFRARDREYALKHRDRIKVYHRAYYRKNRDRHRAYMGAWERAKYRSDPRFNLVTRLRKRLQLAIRSQGRGVYKAGKSVELFGCSPELLSQHIESLFLPGMTWANRSEWHVDHIIPCSAFDLTDPGQQRACFHYTNLQPLWARDNLAKGGVRKSRKNRAA